MKSTRIHTNTTELRTGEGAATEVFSAESEARVCQIVMGLKSHGLEHLPLPH